MSARIYKFAIFSLLVLIPSLSFASVSINELFYSPSSKQWVEIYNDTESSIDLTSYKILDSGAPVNGHAITAISGGVTIATHSYGIIAKVPEDFAGVSYPIFKASLGIKTGGDSIILKNGSAVVDTVSTDGSATGGNSWQKAEGNWISALPTPGSTNASSPATSGTDNPPTSTTTTSTSSTMSATASGNVIAIVSTHYSYLPLSDFTAKQSLAVSAGRSRLATVGNPVEFQAEANIEDSTVIYEWNFGDGTTGSGKMIRHIYEYPGDYVVVLNATSVVVKSIARTNVKVIAPTISVVEANENFIEVKNNSKDEVNLYGWELASNGQSFIFPKDTIVAAGAKVAFARDVTYMAPRRFSDVSLSVIQSKNQSASLILTDPIPAVTLERLYQELVALKQSADALALAQRPKQSETSLSTNMPQVASAAIALIATSSSTSTVGVDAQGVSWFQTLKKFLLGTKP